MVDLGDRGAEAVAQVVLRRAHEVTLSLQRRRLREVQLDGQDRDEARRHQRASYDASAERDRAGGLVERRALDLARLEHLEHVAFAQVVEALEQDAALEPFGHLADVVLEPAQLRDGRLVDARAVAEEPDAASCGERHRS